MHVQSRVTKLGRHKAYEEQLWKLQVLGLEKKRLRGHLIPLYNSLARGCSKVGLTSSPVEKMMDKRKQP